MLDTLSMPPAGGLDETDEQKRARLLTPNVMPPAGTPAPSNAQPSTNVMPPAGQPQPQPAAPTNVMPPASSQPSQPPPTPANAMPPAMVPTQTPQQKPPELHGWKKALDAVGSVFPIGRAIESAIPGTPQNWELTQAKEAERRQSAAKASQEESLATQEQAKAEALLHPPAKPPLAEKDTWKQVPETNWEINSATGETRQMNGVTLPTKEDKPGEYKPYTVPNSKEPIMATQKGDKLFTRDGKELDAGAVPYEKPDKPPTPERPPRQMMITPDGKVIEVTPGMQVPTGARTVPEFGQIGQQEQQRADMAENLNENLTQLEGILERRPDLFGPVAGRIAGAKSILGTSDQDIASLKTIEDMIGRAQVSAHGMRNGTQVEKAANSVLNSFHNSPDAIKAAIKTARDSVKTFTADVESKGGRTGATPAPGSNVIKYDTQGNRVK